jgi:hypothetical protein
MPVLCHVRTLDCETPYAGEKAMSTVRRIDICKSGSWSALCRVWR